MNDALAKEEDYLDRVHEPLEYRAHTHTALAVATSAFCLGFGGLVGGWAGFLTASVVCIPSVYIASKVDGTSYW